MTDILEAVVADAVRQGRHGLLILTHTDGVRNRWFKTALVDESGGISGMGALFPNVTAAVTDLAERMGCMPARPEPGVCDVCAGDLGPDDQGQRTADAIVCEPCATRLCTRSEEAAARGQARAAYELGGEG